VTLDKRLNLLPRFDQFRKKAAERLRVLVPLPKRKKLLSITNGFVRYKKFVRPVME
jgi:hypothetical protein